MLKSLRFSFAVVFAHKTQYQEPCQRHIGDADFVPFLLECFESAHAKPQSENSCVEDFLTMFEGANPSCIQCVEHFVEDHLLDAISQCPPEYISAGGSRNACAASITSELRKDCF